MASAPPAKPPKPEFDDCDETSIKCVWEPTPGVAYRLQYKEFPEPWEECMSLEVEEGKGNAETTQVADLNPTSTYTLRLIAIKDGLESEPSDELIVDTQAANCTPTPDEMAPKKCVVS